MEFVMETCSNGKPICSKSVPAARIAKAHRKQIGNVPSRSFFGNAPRAAFKSKPTRTSCRVARIDLNGICHTTRQPLNGGIHTISTKSDQPRNRHTFSIKQATIPKQFANFVWTTVNIAEHQFRKRSNAMMFMTKAGAEHRKDIMPRIRFVSTASKMNFVRNVDC